MTGTTTRVEQLIERLQHYYDFQCEGGPLSNCVEWQELQSLVSQQAKQIAMLTSSCPSCPSCAAKDAQLAEQRAELTGSLGELLNSIPACYDTIPDHYREMARRIVEDRDVLKHENRKLRASTDTAERALASLTADFDQKITAAKKDAIYHADCRPNRQQAEAWRDDAKAMNDQWADEVAAHRATAEALASLQQPIAGLVTDMRASVTAPATGRHPCAEWRGHHANCLDCGWSEMAHDIWTWADRLVRLTDQGRR